MTTYNLSGGQDSILTRMANAPEPSELVDIVEYLDKSLTEAKDRIAELETEIKELRESRE